MGVFAPAASGAVAFAPAASGAATASELTRGGFALAFAAVIDLLKQMSDRGEIIKVYLNFKR